MVSTYTPNKNLELPGFNDYVNSWNTPVNADFTAIDTALGGVTNLNATSVSGDVTLTSSQYRPFQIIVGGTLTANVRYLIPSSVGGQWTVTNNTSGAFTLKIASAAGGSDITLASGTTMVSCDGTATGMRLSNSGSYPGGLTGYVQFNTAGLFNGNANLFWDNTNGRLGIGTSTPDSSLTVIANNTNNALRINQAGTGNAILVEDNTNPDATPFVVDQNGNVGIGVLAPTSQVQIYNATASSLLVTGDSTTSIVSSRASTDASAPLENFRKYRGTIASPIAVASQDQVGVTSYSAYDGSTLRVTSQIMGAVETYTNLNDLSGFLSFLTRPTGLGGALAERMRISGNGNVGIGTTTPDALLTVNTVASFGAGSAAAPSIAAKGDLNTGIFFPAADTMAFAEGGAEVMRIDSAGNVGIGTISPDALLTVNTVASFGAGSAAAPSIAAKGDLNTGMYFPGADRIGFSDGGVQVGEFDASANFKFNSGYGSVATAYGCRAWVNFNGTGTVAIRASGNVTSITDNGTGDYTVNFTTAMPDANYSSVAGCAKSDGNNDGNQIAQVGGYLGALQTSSTCRIRTVYVTLAAQDSPQVTFAAFR